MQSSVSTSIQAKTPEAKTHVSEAVLVDQALVHSDALEEARLADETWGLPNLIGHTHVLWHEAAGKGAG